MKNYIRESFIRNKIRILLLEAVIDDLISKSKREPKEWHRFEESLTDAGIQKNSSTIGNYLKWVFKCVSEDSDEPLEDVVGLILDFDELKNKPSKWQIRNDQGEFEKLSPDIFSFDRDSLAITIETIKQSDLDYLEKKSESNIEPIAVIDKWEIYFPTNIPESVEIANKGKLVNWCTARTSNNLFYAYALYNTFLFYILKSGDPTSKYCISVQSGRVVPGSPGGVTVDMKNNGFDDSYQNEVFSSDVKNQIHQKLIEINSKFGQIHPARSIPLKAAGNLKMWKQMVGPWSKDNRRDFIRFWFGQKTTKDNHELVDCVTIDVLNHIIRNQEYYSLKLDTDPILNNIIEIYSLKNQNNKKLYSIVHETTNIDFWHNKFSEIDVYDRLAILKLLINQSPNFKFRNDDISKIIFEDVFFWNFHKYFSKDSRISDYVQIDGLKTYHKKFKNTELDKLAGQVGDIKAWRSAIARWPENLVRVIITSADFPVLPKILEEAENAKVDNNADIKIILEDILTNHNNTYYGYSTWQTRTEKSKLEKIYGEAYSKFVLELQPALNIFDAWPDKESTKFRLKILKNESLWKKFIINNHVPIPDEYIVSLFGFLLCYAKISDVKQFDANVIKQLIDILLKNKHKSELHREFYNDTSYYICWYLIIKNDGLDLKFLNNISKSLNKNKDDILYTLFNGWEIDNPNNLVGTGLIKKDIYHEMVNKITDIIKKSDINEDEEELYNQAHMLECIQAFLKREPFYVDQELKKKLNKVNLILSQMI